MSAILNFYGGTGTDAAGRTFKQVLALTDAEFESEHNFIQWLFPLPEPSRAVPSSPIMTETDIAEFKSDQILRILILQALMRTIDFYNGTTRWIRPYDHNHLRITRILRFLMLVGQEERAKGFLTYVLQRTESVAIPEDTEQFWILAVYPDIQEQVAGFSGT